jgi:hypothetical protein
VKDMVDTFRITIEDLTKLRITKIREGHIYFDYAEKHYLLMERSDDEDYITLYERELSNSKVRLHYINSKMDCDGTERFILDVSRKPNKSKTITYVNVDKKYFVNKLTRIGFATSIYSNNKSSTLISTKPDTLRDIAAWHEAGHMTVAEYFGIKPDSITISKDAFEIKFDLRSLEVEQRVQVIMAGYISSIINAKHSVPESAKMSQSDLQKAYLLLEKNKELKLSDVYTEVIKILADSKE